MFYLNNKDISFSLTIQISSHYVLSGGIQRRSISCYQKLLNVANTGLGNVNDSHNTLGKTLMSDLVQAPISSKIWPTMRDKKNKRYIKKILRLIAFFWMTIQCLTKSIKITKVQDIYQRSVINITLNNYWDTWIL